MSSREKNLLISMLVVGFLVLNAGALKLFYLPRLEAARAKKLDMENAYLGALIALEDQADQQEEIDWLLKYEQEPMQPEVAESELEKLANLEAQRRGLSVDDRRPDTPITDPALNYHRVRLEMKVSGGEKALYEWIDRLNSPADFRTVTMMRLSPKRDDDTQVDCEVVIERWFEPISDT